MKIRTAILSLALMMSSTAYASEESVEIARRAKDALREKYLATRVMAECLNSPDCEKQLGFKIPAGVEVMAVIRMDSAELHQWDIYVIRPETDTPPVIVRFNFFTKKPDRCPDPELAI